VNLRDFSTLLDAIIGCDVVNITFKGCLKKRPHKEIIDFFTLKMLPVALALIKPEKPPILHGKLFKSLNSYVK